MAGGPVPGAGVTRGARHCLRRPRHGPKLASSAKSKGKNGIKRARNCRFGGDGAASAEVGSPTTRQAAEPQSREGWVTNHAASGGAAKRDRAARGGPEGLPGGAMPHRKQHGGFRGAHLPDKHSATAPQLGLRRRGHCVASDPLADGGTAWRSAAAQRHNTSLLKPKQVMTIGTRRMSLGRLVRAAKVTAAGPPRGPKLGPSGTGDTT
jgi:hypothetical protein